MGIGIPQQVWASGVIEDAPSLSSLLTRILQFLLEVFGIVAILMVVVIGAFYLFVSDDKKALLRAKKSFASILIGIIAGLGALVLVRQIAGYF